MEITGKKQKLRKNAFILFFALPTLVCFVCLFISDTTINSSFEMDLRLNDICRCIPLVICLTTINIF